MIHEYKGFKYGFSICGDTIHFYTEKMMQQGKPQKQLKASTLAAAHREIKKMIDKKLRPPLTPLLNE